MKKMISKLLNSLVYIHKIDYKNVIEKEIAFGEITSIDYNSSLPLYIYPSEGKGNYIKFFGTEKLYNDKYSISLNNGSLEIKESGSIFSFSILDNNVRIEVFVDQLNGITLTDSGNVECNVPVNRFVNLQSDCDCKLSYFNGEFISVEEDCNLVIDYALCNHLSIIQNNGNIAIDSGLIEHLDIESNDGSDVSIEADVFNLKLLNKSMQEIYFSNVKTSALISTGGSGLIKLNGACSESAHITAFDPASTIILKSESTCVQAHDINTQDLFVKNGSKFDIVINDTVYPPELLKNKRFTMK